MPYRYEYREEHRGLAFFLAVAMHVLLAIFLLVSVQWQTRQPETVSVELWGGPPPPPLEQPEPETVLPPPVKQPEPEALPEEKPDIATEKVKPRPTIKPTNKPTPVPTVAPTKKPQATPVPQSRPVAGKTPEKMTEEDAFLKALQGGMTARSKGETKAQSGNMAGGTGSVAGATGVGAGGTGSLDDYRSRLIALFKSRLVYPDDSPGNPRVSLRISVIPDGSIRHVTVLKASGDQAYDDAAVRAVYAVDRLPDPGRGRSFRDPDLREFTVNFTLREK